MDRLPLLIAGSLMFLTLCSALYLVAWLCMATALRFSRGRLPHSTAKRLLLGVLVGPPILAAAAVLTGAFYHHMHGTTLQHHSALCGSMYDQIGRGGVSWSSWAPLAVFAVGTGWAWLLLATGLFFFLRRLWATFSLQKGLEPFLSAASPRLASAVEDFRRRHPRLRPDLFVEAPIPADRSGLLGVSWVKCVLSRNLVETASDVELQAVVAHEACHLLSGDVAATHVVQGLSRFFFWLRPVQLLAQRWQEESELACDEAAIALTRQPLAMAAAILRASGAPVDGVKGVPEVITVVPLLGSGVPARRVETLLSHAYGNAQPGSESLRWVMVAWFSTAATLGLSAFIVSQNLCYTHCSLEVLSRWLP